MSIRVLVIQYLLYTKIMYTQVMAGISQGDAHNYDLFGAMYNYMYVVGIIM